MNVKGRTEKPALIASVRAQAALKQTSQDEVIEISSRVTGRPIRAHIYCSRSKATTPILVNFHGSGFVIPFHRSDGEFARHVANAKHYTVLDVLYGLAPEDQLPAVLNDVEDTVNWVLSKPQEFNSGNLVISGFSSGANLALVASSQLFQPSTFQGVVLFYPPVDFAIRRGQICSLPLG